MHAPAVGTSRIPVPHPSRGARAPHSAAEGTGGLIGACLEEAGLQASDIPRVAYMNTERAMTEERLLAPLGLTLEQSTWEFGRAAGHVSASDQVISFDHLSRGPTRRPSTCSGAPYPG